MNPHQVEVGKSYRLAGRACDIRVLRSEEVEGGFIKYRVEKISGNQIGAQRWEYSEYLRFAIREEIA